MGNRYDGDIVAWAYEQAELLRKGKWEQLDIENLAEEIESVGRTEKRELRSRLAVLLAHLLKWHFQAELRSNSWLRTMRAQRREISRMLQKMPSLRPCLSDHDWLEDTWEDAVQLAARDTGIEVFPDNLVWTIDEALAPELLPD